MNRMNQAPFPKISGKRAWLVFGEKLAIPTPRFPAIAVFLVPFAIHLAFSIVFLAADSFRDFRFCKTAISHFSRDGSSHVWISQTLNYEFYFQK
jgi:hypothetical protein